MRGSIFRLVLLHHATMMASRKSRASLVPDARKSSPWQDTTGHAPDGKTERARWQSLESPFVFTLQCGLSQHVLC